MRGNEGGARADVRGDVRAGPGGGYGPVRYGGGSDQEIEEEGNLDVAREERDRIMSGNERRKASFVCAYNMGVEEAAHLLELRLEKI
mmetsp:Transcript_19633/g.47157  ORF Transcript_19633/g.47157 Transcript_19633/m.47157 type:complete len:87 (-) Transcript_19633:173-433(-)